MVQANLCLWIFFTVESSVEHSGACHKRLVIWTQYLQYTIWCGYSTIGNDYSLSFSWLKGTG
ncbi:hypothetical protein PF008_g5911 [Phytophthora fragariae]|uniref:Uncharacterized protein n=1 Tax=Phytophthora fragariae TaxID=53985 RepID=A0A6G0S7I7_9STRA|nr:hypothetical protein PF008_g5911 [Phytophthora fragariae]